VKHPLEGCFLFSRQANFLRQGSLNIERRLKNEHEIIPWFIGSGGGAGSYRRGVADDAGLDSKK